MNLLISITVGVLFAAGAYLVLRRAWFKVVLGLAILGHACVILIFSFGRTEFTRAPIIGDSHVSMQSAYSDPLPQALILTAIVIGFGVQAFLLVLFRKAAAAMMTTDIDHLEEGEC